MSRPNVHIEDLEVVYTGKLCLKYLYFGRMKTVSKHGVFEMEVGQV